MLRITVPQKQFWNEETKKFEYTKETVLVLEHSLISISKWEAKFHKPFYVSKKDKKEKRSEAETLYYIKCMTINTVNDDRVYLALTPDNVDAIEKYITDPMTATKLSKSKKSNSSKKEDTRPITSELVYYWMIQYGIPHEYEKWHFERLLTLIRLCSEEAEKHDPKKKKERKKTTTEQLDRMAALNERRKAALHTRG